MNDERRRVEGPTGRKAGVRLRSLAAAAGLSVVIAGAASPAAFAAEDVITVTTNERCNPDGTAIAGSLQAALEAANASTNADGVRIVFAEGLDEISFNSTVCAMHDATIGVGNEIAGLLGARYLVDSAVPVTIDFTNLPAITTTTDADFAGFYVHSDDVVLENLANLKAGAAGIAIDGARVRISGIEFKDPDSAISEVGVALLDGASDVTIEDSVFHSQWWSSILIDGSVANPTTVSNVVVDNVTSRGVESAYGHLDIEDGAIVDGLTVRDSTFGASDESSTTHAVYVNPSVDVTGLVYSGNTVLRGTGPERNVFYFEGGAQTFTDTVIDGNTFTGASTSAPLSRIIGSNAATWSGLELTNNEAELTRGILMVGATITDAVLSGNTFTRTLEPAGAAIHLQGTLEDVTVADNVLDTPWAVDGIRVQGATPATNVVIENNTIHDFHADGSRSSIAIIAPGAGSVVRGNELVQHLDRAGVDLPSTLNNHWAVYVWLESSAANADTSTGWSIVDNAIDGFDGWSDAPIVVNAIGRTLVTGNTFGEHTQGSFDPETENGRQWFVWNTTGLVNHKVQTFRAEDVRLDGTTGSFTATRPEPEAGNTAATAPVTLHVYWTADDHAEEYLGAIADVTPGQRVSIPTAHTTGYLRVQTVDASGNTSQYSSIDQDVTVAPGPPVVTGTTATSATGTGEPEATVVVRDADGEDVTEASVDAEGSWTASGLACGTTYTVVQIVDGVESDEAELTTQDCPAAPAAPVVEEVTADVVRGTGEPGATVTLRDGDGAVVATGRVAEDGSWSFDGAELACGTSYTVTQTVDGVDSEPAELTTPACVTPTPTPTPSTSSTATPSPSASSGGHLSDTGASGVGMVALGTLVLLAAGGALVLATRRRTA
ncbi:parallel beta helix pectate lyase-like protein [Salana multivorans]|uniref:Parallel beta helix pectate lyase-like protein n=1 Tax=Salana multivorans TaxID=120377 RepID=A0A3N2DCG7_9MICO|nr:Ig-like domain-containing protein [Salana multivorans]ROR97134.1 parallel beta helix pectate lyase-like protein [Salana multivorans]